MTPDRVWKIVVVGQGEIKTINFSANFYIQHTLGFADSFPLIEKYQINSHQKIHKYEPDDMVPYVGLPECNDTQIREVVMRPYKEVAGRQIFKKGDILFARIEPSIFNKKYIYVDNTYGHDYIFTSTEFIVITGSSETETKYLYNLLFLSTLYDQFSGKTTGSSGRRRLERSVLENLAIPNNNDQHTIVSLMDLALARKQEMETQASDLLAGIDQYVMDELGIIYEPVSEKKVFTVNVEELGEGKRLDVNDLNPGRRAFFDAIRKVDNLTQIKEIIKDQTYGILPKSNEYGVDENTFLFRATDLKENMDIDVLNLISIPSKYFTNQKVRLQKGDILIAAKGATIAGNKSVCYIKDDIKNTIINGSIFKFQPKNQEVNGFYIACFLNSELGKKQMKLNLVANNAVDYLNKDVIESIYIPLPPRDIQDRIASEVSHRITTARSLQSDAKAIYDQAKQEVEKMILGS